MTAKPEYELLCLLTFVDPDEEERQRITRALEQVTDWNGWHQLAVFNKIVPICYYSLQQLGLNDKVPASIWTRMEQDTLAIQNKNELRNREAAVFLNRFTQQAIPVALLKGVAFGEIVYRNPSYKRMNDIDILVRKKDIDAIYAIYDSLHYFFIGERIAGSRQKSDKVSHLSPPFISPDYHCVIGTQWGIKTPLSPYRINYDELWSRVSPVTLRGVEVYTLSPEDHLHHLCLHLGYFKISLRDMMDFYNLLRVHGHRFDWELFYHIVTTSKTENPVYFGLAISQFIYSLPEVPLFLQQIESHVQPHYKKAARWKTRSLAVFLHLHSDHIQTIEKAISEFDATSYFPEKLRYFTRMWGYVWFPAREEVIRMSALYQPGVLQVMAARCTIPFKILRVLAGEVGWSLIFLLMLKTVIDLGVTFFKFPFTRREKSDSRAYARKLGIPPEKLLQLKEQFQ